MTEGGPHVAIMQPYFFPYIGYWQMLAMSDVFVVYDDGLFRKDGWINRNRILGRDGGEPMMITLPVRAKSRNRTIAETEIGRDPRYPTIIGKMLRSIEMRYRKAPHYEETMEVIRPLLACEETDVVKFLVTGIRGIMSYLRLDTRLVLSSEIDKTGLTGVVEKVERICKTIGICDYVNLYGGEALYDKGEFARRGLNLSFIRRDPDLSYPQFGDGFVPDLSIIDVMMFNSPEEIGALLRRYTLY